MPTVARSRTIWPSSYELRKREYGERAAKRWLLRQHLLYPLHLLVDRAGTALANIAAVGPQAARDAVYAARALARTPALTITIALTIGIGLGATTAMIGVVRAVLVNPLPYASPDKLFWIYTDNPPFKFRLSVVDYRALEADHPAFTSIAAYQTTTVTVSEGGAAERVTAKSVTGSYFPLLGQTALLGRLLDESDDARGDRPIVLTAAYWGRRFASDPNVLGRVITVDGARLHHRRRPAERRRAARARRCFLHAGAVAAAAPEGAVLHDGPRPSPAGRAAGGGSGCAARHEQTAVSDLEIVVSGREGHLGHARLEGAGRWRRRSEAAHGARGRGLRPADRVRQRDQPAHRARSSSQPRAGNQSRPGCTNGQAAAVSGGRERAADAGGATCRRGHGGAVARPRAHVWRRVHSPHRRGPAFDWALPVARGSRRRQWRAHPGRRLHARHSPFVVRHEPRAWSGRPLGHRRPNCPALAPGARLRTVRARHTAGCGGAAGDGQPRAPEPGRRRRRNAAHVDGGCVLVRAGISGRTESQSVLGPRARTCRRAAGRRGRGARR